MTEKKEDISAAMKLRVLARDRYRCTYCGISGNDAELQIDHITALANGGSNHIGNLTTSCRKCNQSKGKKKIGEFIGSITKRYDNGMYLISFHQEGAYKGHIEYTGKIIGEDDFHYIVQMFDAAFGGESNVEFWDKNETKKICKFYASREVFDFNVKRYMDLMPIEIPKSNIELSEKA